MITIRFFTGSFFITQFKELKSNPFNVGDEVILYIDYLDDERCAKMNPTLKEHSLSKQDEILEKFENKKMKLIKETKLVRFNALDEVDVLIDYTCDLI